jgi:hypothetical protein
MGRLGAAALIVIGVLAVVSPAVASAAAWEGPKDLSDSTSKNAGQQVAIDQNGNAVAVWNHWPGGGGDGSYVQASTRTAGGEWSSPVALSPQLGEEWDIFSPDVAMDAAGDAVAIWSQNTPGTQFALEASIKPAGGEWSAPVTLSATGVTGSDATLAMDPAGDATVVWSDRSPSILHARTLSIGAKEWSAPVTIAGAGGEFSDIQVLYNAAGDAGMVWRRKTGEFKYALEGALRPAGGEWQPPVALASTAYSPFFPQAAIDPAGNVTAAWDSIHGEEVVETADLTVGGGWGPRTVIEAITWSEPSIEHLALAIDRAGNALLAFEAREEGSFKTRVRVASRPSGGAWQSPVLLSPAGVSTRTAALAFDGAGDATLLWRAAPTSDHVVLQALKKPAGGEWTTPVDLTPVLAGNSVEEQAIEYPALAVDGDDDAVTAWTLNISRYESTVQASTIELDNPPHLSGGAIVPNLWGGGGGTSEITATASDDRGIGAVRAVITLPKGGTAEIELPAVGGGAYEGSYKVPFNPTASPQTYAVEVVAEDTSGQVTREAAGTITVEPKGTPNPGYLVFEPGTLRFGAHSISGGETTIHTVVLRNDGKAGSPPITGFVRSSNPEFTLIGAGKEGLPFTVAPGSPQTLEVAFKASAKGPQEGRLTLVRADGRGQPNASVALFGWGLK